MSPKVSQRYKSPHFGESAYPERSLNTKPYIKSKTNYPKSVLSFPHNNSKTIHPTQKPLEMFEWLIRTYSNPGDVILDTCMGSGTTAIAALNTGRRFIGFETDEGYFRKAGERIAEVKI